MEYLLKGQKEEDGTFLYSFALVAGSEVTKTWEKRSDMPLDFSKHDQVSIKNLNIDSLEIYKCSPEKRETLASELPFTVSMASHLMASL